jgi:hypothetical protein
VRRLATVLAILSFGCNGVQIPPQLLDCRTRGCPPGQECKPTAKPAESALYSCRAVEPPKPEPPKSCATTTCPADRPRCVETMIHGNRSGPVETWTEVVMVECKQPYPLCDAARSRDCWHMTAPATTFSFRCWDGATDAAEPKACPAMPVPEPPKPKPEPKPDPGCDLREGDLVAVDPGRPAKLTEAVLAAEARIGPRPGTDPHVSLARLAAELRRDGYCAIAGIEAVFLRAEDGLVEEFHAVAFGTGDWIAGGRFKGVHREAAPSCPAPLPPRVAGDGITPAWKLKCHPHQPAGTIDCTPTTIAQEPFCRHIGMSPMADGTLRAGCPVRPDGHPDRPACEDFISGGGFRLEARGGAVCEHRDGNPLQFMVPQAGSCRLCSVDGTVCSDWF